MSPAAQEGAVEIDVHMISPLRQRHVLERDARREYAGDVNQTVERTVARDDAVEHLPPIVFRCHVEIDVAGIAAERRTRTRRNALAIGEHHARALVQQHPDDFLANAAQRAGDQDGLILKKGHRLSFHRPSLPQNLPETLIPTFKGLGAETSTPC